MSLYYQFRWSKRGKSRQEEFWVYIEDVQKRSVAQAQLRERSALEIEWGDAIKLKVNKQHAMRSPNPTSKVSGENSNTLFQLAMVAASSLPLDSKDISIAADSMPSPNTPSGTFLTQNADTCV